MSAGLALSGLDVGYAEGGALRRGRVRPVLSGVDAVAARGELTVLLGANGAGKSTLLRTLAGLLPALGGTVTLDGTDLLGLRAPERSRRVGVVLTDMLSDGLSMVYSFFDPLLARRSLGQFAILDHLMQAREQALPFVYLGYWIQGSAKMDYKARLRPLQALTREGWRDLP